MDLPPPTQFTQDHLQQFKSDHQRFLNFCSQPETRGRMLKRAADDYLEPKIRQKQGFWERLENETEEESVDHWRQGFLQNHQTLDCRANNNPTPVSDYTGTEKSISRPTNLTQPKTSVLACFMPIITDEVAQQPDNWEPLGHIFQTNELSELEQEDCEMTSLLDE